MASVVAAPAALNAAASSLTDIGSELNAVTAGAAEQTSFLQTAAADEVSSAVASLFSIHGQEFQKLNAQAAAFHETFTQTLTQGAATYSAAEASAAQTLADLTVGASSLPRPAAAAPAEVYYPFYGYGYGYAWGLLGLFAAFFYMVVASIYNPWLAPLYISEFFATIPFYF
ncbi:PE family protein [Mycobacterium sp.]|uniref:PE family protein n=1 Tax=Mycobacterium sp. TaxID=1785 RepID=UPI003A8A14E1